MSVFVGLREGRAQIFESEKQPDKQTHPQFDIIYGPFKTRKDAENYIPAMGAGVACGEGNNSMNKLDNSRRKRCI